MQHELPLIILILLLLLASRVMGELMERLGQLAMIGEILAGVILGPSLLGVVKPGPELKVLSDLGVFFLVMMAGMEMDFTDVRDAFRGRGVLLAATGFVIPFIVGNLLGRAFSYNGTMSVFLGLCMALTALPVAVRILMDMGRLQSPIGQRLVTVAVQDDVTSLCLLGVILGVKAQGELLKPILFTGAKTALFLLTVWVVYRLVRYSKGHIPHSRKAVAWLENNLRGREPLFALTLLFVLVFAALAEVIGLHFVVGTFFGSMVLNRTILGRVNFEEVEKTASSIGMGFLAPVFFAAIGVEFQIKALSNLPLVGSVLLLAFITKLAGGYAGAKLAGMNSDESWVLAWGMNARGVMELVIADLALKQGFIGADLFSTLVLMGMVTTLATPLLLERAFKRMEARQAQGVQSTLPDRRELAPELMHDLEYRHDWARNASGSETDAGVPQWRHEKARVPQWREEKTG